MNDGMRGRLYPKMLYQEGMDLGAECLKKIEGIEKEVQKKAETEIKSTVIGNMVMERLYDLDEVAYVRFASVYRRFKDVSHFMKELKKFLE